MGTHPIFESDFDCLTEWLEDSRRSSPSKRTPKDRPNSRSKKEVTKRLLLRKLSNSSAPCARPRWATQRHTSSILSRNTRSCQFQLTWPSAWPKANARSPSRGAIYLCYEYTRTSPRDGNRSRRRLYQLLYHLL